LSFSGRRIAVALGAEMRAAPGKAAFLLIGAALLVVLVVRLAGKKPESAEAAETPAAQTAGAPAGAIAPPGALATPAPRKPRPVLAHTVRRDPFAAPWASAALADIEAKPAEEEKEPPALQFTMVDAGGKYKAVIDGSIVTVGSRFGDYQVVRIGRREAVLQKGELELVLRMQGW
jgi:hypothetical protein